MCVITHTAITTTLLESLPRSRNSKRQSLSALLAPNTLHTDTHTHTHTRQLCSIGLSLSQKTLVCVVKGLPTTCARSVASATDGLTHGLSVSPSPTKGSVDHSPRTYCTAECGSYSPSDDDSIRSGRSNHQDTARNHDKENERATLAIRETVVATRMKSRRPTQFRTCRTCI
jgi:hypothetical protein